MELASSDPRHMTRSHPIGKRVWVGGENKYTCYIFLSSIKCHLSPVLSLIFLGLGCSKAKECSEQIAPSLCALFNYSLRIGRFPSDWKSADITPVHKKDLPEPAENYRPISLLPMVSKVMERCVCNRLYSHVSQQLHLYIFTTKFLCATYFNLLDTTYNIDMPCTSFLSRNCPCHRS